MCGCLDSLTNRNRLSIARIILWGFKELSKSTIYSLKFTLKIWAFIRARLIWRQVVFLGGEKTLLSGAREPGGSTGPTRAKDMSSCSSVFLQGTGLDLSCDLEQAHPPLRASVSSSMIFQPSWLDNEKSFYITRFRCRQWRRTIWIAQWASSLSGQPLTKVPAGCSWVFSPKRPAPPSLRAGLWPDPQTGPPSSFPKELARPFD